jgi:hypothetical protein
MTPKTRTALQFWLPVHAGWSHGSVRRGLVRIERGFDGRDGAPLRCSQRHALRGMEKRSDRSSVMPEALARRRLRDGCRDSGCRGDGRYRRSGRRPLAHGALTPNHPDRQEDIQATIHFLLRQQNYCTDKVPFRCDSSARNDGTSDIETHAPCARVSQTLRVVSIDDPPGRNAGDVLPSVIETIGNEEDANPSHGERTLEIEKERRRS